MLSSLYLHFCRAKWGRQQRKLRERLIQHDEFTWTLDDVSSEARPLRLIGGVDISFFSNEQDPHDQRAVSTLVVLERNAAGDLNVVWEDFEFVYMDQPYIAGFLAFREVPHLKRLLDRLVSSRSDLIPDVLMVDGNGILHPVGFGCASHFGVVCDVCTIGVAKNLHMVDGLDRNAVKKQTEQVNQGDHVPLVGRSGRTWGAALLPAPPSKITARLKDPKNPIFISVGHRISLETSLRVASLCCVSRREPEPTRIADMRSRDRVRQAKLFTALHTTLGSMSADRDQVIAEEVSALKQAIQDAKSVVSDKTLLKPVTQTLAALEAVAESQQAKYANARSEALVALQPLLAPPPRGIRYLPPKSVLPVVIGIGLCITILLTHRRKH